MDEDNISRALIIGVTTFIGIITVSAIIIFFNASLNTVRNAGSGMDYSTISRNDIESTLLMSGTGNYIKGSSVINLLSYYEQDTNVTMSVQNIKYIDQSGQVQIYENITIESDDPNVRESAYNSACRYIMDNQDFTIDVQDIDTQLGTRNITIKGV